MLSGVGGIIKKERVMHKYRLSYQDVKKSIPLSFDLRIFYYIFVGLFNNHV